MPPSIQRMPAACANIAAMSEFEGLSTRVIARVVEVSRIEIHGTPLSMDRTIATFGTRILGDKLVTIVRGFGWAAVAAHHQNDQ